MPNRQMQRNQEPSFFERPRKRTKPSWAAVLVLALWPLAANAQPASTPATPTETLGLLSGAGRVSSGQKFFGDAKYVGSQTCKECHAKQYDDWAATWHAKMERWPSPDIVVGDFNNRTVAYKNIPIKTKDGKDEKVSFSVVTGTKDAKFYFTVVDQDNSANNQTYEIAKVLGGKWDQHYEVKIGENYIPTPIRWSVAAKDWLVTSYRPYDWVEWDGTPDGRPRKPDELPKGRFAEAKCSGCHTTGFEFYKDAAAGHWKARGNGELGIACERCHGPSGKHVDEAKAAKTSNVTLAADKTTIVRPLKDLSALQQTELCGQCHGRNTNKKNSDLSFQQGFLPGDIDMTDRARFWNYSGTSNPDEYRYFWPNDWAKRNRQQWQDFTKSTHFNKVGMSCITCHTFHGTWEGPQLRQKPEEMCVGCHTSGGFAKRPNAEMFEGSPMQQAGVRCVDCHMPKIGYRSARTSKGPNQWDTSSHTFMVATPAMEKAQGIRSSCSICHEGEGRKMPNGTQAPPLSLDDLDNLLKQRQADTRAGIDGVQRILTSVKSKKPEATRLIEAASAKLNVALLDGSISFHNFPKAEELIGAARQMAEKAAKLK